MASANDTDLKKHVVVFLKHAIFLYKKMGGNRKVIKETEMMEMLREGREASEFTPLSGVTLSLSGAC